MAPHSLVLTPGDYLESLAYILMINLLTILQSYLPHQSLPVVNVHHVHVILICTLIPAHHCQAH